MRRPSRLAFLRFVADSTPWSLWGSNQQEQEIIDLIREDYAPWLYDANPPPSVLDGLAPLSEKLFANDQRWDDLIGMYEP